MTSATKSMTHSMLRRGMARRCEIYEKAAATKTKGNAILNRSIAPIINGSKTAMNLSTDLSSNDETDAMLPVPK